MNINSLKKFMVIAQYNHLSTASTKLNQTPAALSKVIKRLEQQLSTQLFDRIGRNIKLNRNGQKLLEYAVVLVHETDQMISEFSGESDVQNINIAGPSILLNHLMPQLMRVVDQKRFRFGINVVWEGEALNNVSTGQADIAVITQFATENSKQHNIKSQNILSAEFCIAAARNHPALKACDESGEISSLELMNHDFVCPTVSPFCGINRGEASDGWKHNDIARKLTYRSNDFSVLLNMVKQGLALAYVPDFMVRDHDLVNMKLKGRENDAHEIIQLVHKPSMASGWLNRFLEDCASITTL